MSNPAYLSALLFFAPACASDDKRCASDDGVPCVASTAEYPVIIDSDITYAEALAHNKTSTAPITIPLKLDVYYPDTSVTNRPVFMFIHGGGFTGGTKTRDTIEEMADYYAARGWVFASIDYRTTETLCDAVLMPECEEKILEMTGGIDLLKSGESDPTQVAEFYAGIAPQEWVSFLVKQGPKSVKVLQQGIAKYAAQRDAKAALRWLVANGSTYDINTDYITVGGASAGAVTTFALGISNADDFRDEISLDADPTLASTNLDETYAVQSMVWFWGSTAKLDMHEGVYELAQYDRYDSGDPEIFMGHGTAEDPVTPYTEAEEVLDVYESMGVHSELATLLMPDGSPAGHGAWEAEVDGKGLSELTFDFLVDRQNLNLE
jgi:predicted esterase